MNIALIILVIALIALGLVEAFLRIRYGLGNPPLYLADARTGYRLKPNQRLKRLGNQIEVNQFSMRGPAISPQRPDDTLRVLLLGDSIINGGWWTDQSDILSALLQTQLASALSQQFGRVEVLNASANSWGPRNQLGYVARFGLFESQIVLVVLNTDDLFAIAPTSVQVGRDRSYPRRKPLLAIFEAIGRVQTPRPLTELEALQEQESGDRVGSNLEAIRQIKLRSEENYSRLILTMTPLRRELEDDGPRDYELIARQRLLTFTQREQIPYLDFLPIFQQNPDFAALYRDHIHLSPQGNQLVTLQLAQFVQTALMTSAPAFLPAPLDDTGEDLWQ
ncbi:MAG TPA: SGNH/GDSL hydrolase family protein [Trichocoleus sp.]